MQDSYLKVEKRGDGDDYVRKAAVFVLGGWLWLFANIHEGCDGGI